MKILMCQFGTETNTFAHGDMEFAQQAPYGWVRGEDVVEKFTGVRTYLGGALAAMAEEGVTPLPIDMINQNGTFGAGAPLSRACTETILDGICAGIRARLGQFDGIFFALHGAGVCEFDDDLESLTLRRIRDIVGPDMLIMSSMDLHGNLTDEMVRLSDGLFSIKEVPHTDLYEAGHLAAKTLIAAIRGQVKPVMALRRLPMLVSATVACTHFDPAKKIREHFAAYCKEHGLIDCTFLHGFSPTDAPVSSCSVLVIADGYRPDREADELAAYVWALRQDFLPDPLTAAQAVDQALAQRKDGYVVINEASDNPGGGCPGDGTHLLREFLDRDLPGFIMGPVYDPETATFLHRHKVGDRVSITLGGKTDPAYGAPLELDGVEILGLCDCKFTSESPLNAGVTMDYGPSARCRKGNVEFIVVSVRYQTLDAGTYTATGADLKDYRVVGLKSMNHFRGYFRPRADAIVTADTPGLRSDPRLFDYKRVLRPIYPLDMAATYDGHWPK